MRLFGVLALEGDTVKEKEILAPAGSEAAFLAAVENGADAVYMGGKAFNARSYADNFEPGDIRRLCRYAHLLGVKVFLTLNILILPQEVERALDYARKLALAGVDALIVQDIGLAAALGKIVGPEVEIHASTQMTLMNSWGLDFAEALGCSRVVLAREVSAANIRRMKEKSPLLLEVFGHGALCSGWSGQCLFSSLLGGRSGNRGQCAQPCRLKYQLTDGEGRSLTDTGSQGAYLLSTKDLCTVEFLDQLLEAGAGSFKLEGRMKQPEYVAMVTRQYREAMEEAGGALVPGEEKSGDQKGGLEEAKKKNLQRRLAVLSRCFNRGFTSGYYLRLPGSHLMSRQKPNNQSQIDESLRQSARESFRCRAAAGGGPSAESFGSGPESPCVWICGPGRWGPTKSQIRQKTGLLWRCSARSLVRLPKAKELAGKAWRPSWTVSAVPFFG